MTWSTLVLAASGRASGGRPGGGIRPGGGSRPGGAATPPSRLGSFAGSHSIGGLNVTDGRVVLGIGVALVLVGLMAVALHRGAFHVYAAALSAALGAVIVSIATAEIFVGAGFGGPASLFPRIASRIQTTTGPGLYVALGGGAIAVLSGAAGLLAGRAGWGRASVAGAANTAPIPPPPAGTTETGTA